jgi:hypothetical protein
MTVLRNYLLCSVYLIKWLNTRGRVEVFHVSVHHDSDSEDSISVQRKFRCCCWPFQTPLCSYALSPWNACTALFWFWLNYASGSRQMLHLFVPRKVFRSSARIMFKLRMLCLALDNSNQTFKHNFRFSLLRVWRWQSSGLWRSVAFVEVHRHFRSAYCLHHPGGGSSTHLFDVDILPRRPLLPTRHYRHCAYGLRKNGREKK